MHQNLSSAVINLINVKVDSAFFASLVSASSRFLLPAVMKTKQICHHSARKKSSICLSSLKKRGSEWKWRLFTSSTVRNRRSSISRALLFCLEFLIESKCWQGYGIISVSGSRYGHFPDALCNKIWSLYIVYIEVFPVIFVEQKWLYIHTPNKPEEVHWFTFFHSYVHLFSFLN